MNRQSGRENNMQVKNIAVVGGGTMGIGIAYVSALSGAEVILVEPSDRQAKVRIFSGDNQVTGQR